VSRFKLVNDQLTAERIIVDNIPGAIYHDGGRIKFGPDNLLYITTGDASVPSLAQDTTSLAGKILRVKKDGSIPNDNPFGNEVFSYGHRNPQGVDWNPANDRLYASEHGPTRMDEINLINAGNNYGWPNYHCLNQVGAPLDNHHGPLACYQEFTLAPSGIAWLNKNELLVAGLRGEQLRKITFDDDYKTIIEQEELFSNFGRVREVVKYNSKIYIATNNTDGRGSPQTNDDQIIEIDFAQ
jgi:aldose sugar dehydrogenase